MPAVDSGHVRGSLSGRVAWMLRRGWVSVRYVPWCGDTPGPDVSRRASDGHAQAAHRGADDLFLVPLVGGSAVEVSAHGVQ